MKKDTPELMCHALRTLAYDITAPDDVPALCLRDAANMIEELRKDRDQHKAACDELDKLLTHAKGLVNELKAERVSLNERIRLQRKELSKLHEQLKKLTSLKNCPYAELALRIMDIEQDRDMWRDRVKDVEETLKDARQDLKEARTVLLDLATRDYAEHGCDLPDKVEPWFSANVAAEAIVIIKARQAIEQEQNN